MAATPWSPLEIEVNMRDVAEQLDNCITDAQHFARQAAEASHAYRKAQAEAWARARMADNLKTDKAREAWVVEQTEALMLRRNIAESDYDALKLKIRSLQTQADLLRSLGRSSRDLVDSWHGGS